ncbi:hypothetical protein ID106_03270 [Vibrio cholerae]|nr:hypothetical protein [Vibrio cholerae]
MTTRKLYRDMKLADDGFPVLGETTTKLGVRIFGYNVTDCNAPRDMSVEEDGNVHPGKGMSVCPPDINKTLNPRFKKRVEQGKTVVWEIDESVLVKLSLKYEEDSDDHGVIAPMHAMKPDVYTALIKSTRKLWRMTDDYKSE